MRVKRSKLHEEEMKSLLSPTVPGDSAQPQNISVDMKIDKYFLQYEREASPSQEFGTSGLVESLKGKSLASWLFEADDATDMPPEAPPPDLGGGDSPMGPGDAGGAPEGGETAEEPVPTPNLNLNLFATQLSRLINNYDTLLDPKTVILNRAKVYIQKNYNLTMATELLAILEKQFGISQRSSIQKSQDVQAPLSVGAIDSEGPVGSGATSAT